MSSVVSKINPDYGGFGTKQNCRRCTFAYEMRRRGYDVAATKTTDAHGQTLIGLDNAIGPSRKPDRTTGKVATLAKSGVAVLQQKRTGKESTITTLLDNNGLGKKAIKDDDGFGIDPKRIFSALAKEPERSRGELTVNWGMGGGHSVAYEIIKGKPVIFDTQSGKKFTSPEQLAKAYKLDGLFANIADAGFTRLDDVPLNENFLMRWLKNA